MSTLVTTLWIGVGLVIAVCLMWIVDELHKRTAFIQRFARQMDEFDAKLTEVHQVVDGDLAEQLRQVAALKAQLVAAGIIPDTTEPRHGEPGQG